MHAAHWIQWIQSLLLVTSLLALPSHAFALGKKPPHSTSASPSPSPTALSPDLVARLKRIIAVPPLRLKDPLNLGTAHPDDLPNLSGGFSPAQIKKVYNIDSTLGSGAGETIAIIDAYGSTSIAQDVATFSNQYGLPPANLQTYVVPGTAVGSDSGWAMETTLDVEWAHAIAPGATILLVICPSSSVADLLNGIQYASSHASIVSMSFGANESGMLVEETAVSQYFAGAGTVFVASSGDSGYGPEWPSSDPHVVAVGGTTLQLDAFGNRSSETAWSGSGGGVTNFPSSTSQSYWSGSGKREVPDVSYDADPATGFNVYMSSAGHNGWFVVGGTSAGAPQWASIFALLNAKRGASNRLGQPLNTIYDTARSRSFFNDITSGCDDSANTHCAHSSYDDVTGMGSPVTNLFVSALTQSSDPGTGGTTGSTGGTTGSTGSTGTTGRTGASGTSGASGVTSPTGTKRKSGGCSSAGPARNPAEAVNDSVNLLSPLLIALMIQTCRSISKAAEKKREEEQSGK